MATQLPSAALRRAQVPKSAQCACQIRHASLLRRPHRPYTFTQLVTLSDGSTYLTRTTSPQPVYRSTKDTRNHILWQPSSSSLRNVEQDEAGRLRGFRARYGRGWDIDADVQGKDEDGKAQSGTGEGDGLMDLISGAGERYKIQEKRRAEAEEGDRTQAPAATGAKRGKLAKGDK